MLYSNAAVIRCMGRTFVKSQTYLSSGDLFERCCGPYIVLAKLCIVRITLLSHHGKQMVSFRRWPAVFERVGWPCLFVFVVASTSDLDPKTTNARSVSVDCPICSVCTRVDVCAVVASVRSYRRDATFDRPVVWAFIHGRATCGSHT